MCLCWLGFSVEVNGNHDCSCYMTATGREPLFFFLVLTCLYTFQLCWSLGGVKLKWILQAVLQKGKLTLLSFYCCGEHFWAGEFPFRGWDDAGKMKLFPTLFVWLFLSFWFRYVV